MATFTLLSHTFSIPESSKKFLESYIIRVNGYIRKHELDPQLSDDLFERLIEKLSDTEKMGEISEKSIVSIINNLGEPEDIFRDILETVPPSNHSRLTKTDVKEFFRREFHRNGKNGIILGVCSGLAETFEINAIWIRLIFLSLIPAYGFIILIYIILGVLLPDISKSSPLEEKTDFKKQAEGAAEDIENLAMNLDTKTREYTKKHADSIIVRIFLAIGEIFTILIKAFVKTILFCILSLIGIGFLGAGIGIISIAGLVSANPIIDGQIIFSAIPNWLPIIALLCGIAGIILSLIIGSRAIGKSIGSGWLVTCCFVVLGVGLFSAVQTGTSLFGKLQNTYSTGTISTFPIASGSTLTINTENFSFGHSNKHSFLDLGNNRPFIELAVSSDENIHIESKENIQTTSPEESENILRKIHPIVTTFKDNTLAFALTNEKDFSSIVPLSILAREIQISVPKSIHVKILGSYGEQTIKNTIDQD